jgi:multidrug transporter EmrE-like cation transporter
MKYQLLIYLILGGSILTLGDIALKKWAIDDKYLYYAIGLLCYLVGVIFFSLTLREKNLAIANTILVTVNIVTLTLVSYFYFHERLSLVQIGWILLSIIGVVILEMAE